MPRSPTRAEIARATRAQRARSDRVLDRLAMTPARRAFDQAQAGFSQSLLRAERGRLREDADMRILRRFHGQISIGVHRAVGEVQQALNASTRDALESSLRSLTRFLGETHGDAGPLDDDTLFRQIVSTRRAHIDALRTQAVARLRTTIADRVWKQTLEMAASGKHTIGEVVTAAGEVFDGQWWQIERTVRTEASYAFNVAQAEGVRELAKSNPQIMQRWTELVDDATGMPLDDRVGDDSLVMHGQVAPPGGAFTMPADPRAPGAMIGMSWTHPPNRPNDRAVLTPWLRGWAVPAWQYRNGRRVQLR